VSKVTKPSKRNVALEERILEDLDDPKAWLVYGDWLQTAGDPRGELVTLQTMLEAPHHDRLRMLRRVDEMMEKYAAELLGPLRRYPRTLDGKRLPTHTLKRGFIHSLRIGYDSYVEPMQDGRRVDMPERLAEILAHPSAALVQEITLGIFNDQIWDEKKGSSQVYEKLTQRIADAKPRALRRLTIGDFDFPDDTELSWTYIGSIEHLWYACPRLEKLHVQGAEIQLGIVNAPNLKELSIRTGGLSRMNLQRLANASFPNLESLEIWFGDSDYGASGTIEDIRPILDDDGAKLPKLARLGLKNAEFADAIASEIGKSKILPRLSHLDLSMGVMSDEGARALTKHPTAFQHLQALNLSRNCLSTMRGLDRLANNVIFDDQKDSEGERFVDVGE
jgi:uncharacterized protein (TIGR02996 family)